MTTLRVGVAGYAQLKARTIAIARGELQPGRGAPKVWFPSTESLARVLSNRNRSILEAIRKTRPQSISELAEETGLKAATVSWAVQTLAQYGLLTVRHTQGGQMVPRVPYSRLTVAIELSASGGAQA